MSDPTYLQAVVIGVLQGVTELFPVSSLGHSVLLPAWIGGSWQHLVTEYSTSNSRSSPYLAFVVALHVATALTLLFVYRSDWVEIIGAFFRTLRTRRVETSAERLAWLIVIATIPVGITGLALEHVFACGSPSRWPRQRSSPSTAWSCSSARGCDAGPRCPSRCRSACPEPRRSATTGCRQAAT